MSGCMKTIFSLYLFRTAQNNFFTTLYFLGQHEWPSFQCRGCTYGFNLDWKQTNLEKIFYPKPQKQWSSNLPVTKSSSQNYLPQVNTALRNISSTGYIPQASAQGFNNLQKYVIFKLVQLHSIEFRHYDLFKTKEKNVAKSVYF